VAMVGGGTWLVVTRPEPDTVGEKSSTLMLAAVAAPPDPGSIAVLPFDNMPADTTTEYFADGMTDDVIAALARIGKLRVTSRTSVMQYKDARQNLREIAKELGVKNVIEGTVRRMGDSVRIMVRLVDAQSDQMMWTETYDRAFNDVFAIQAEIARQVAATLNADVQPTEAAELGRAPTSNASAYDLFLQARDITFKNRPEERNHLTRLLRQALALDPNYADVYVLLAVSFQQRYVDTGLTDTRLLDSASVYARRALELDPTVQQAHFVLARIYATRNDERYKDEFRKGIALNPSTRDALWSGIGLATQEGRPDESARLARQLIAIEPNRAVNYMVLGSDGYLALGMYEEARGYLTKALELQEDLWPAHRFLVQLYLSTAQIDQAAVHARKLLDLELGGPRGVGPMVWVLMRQGDFRAAVPYVENPALQGTFERAFVYHKLGQRAKVEQSLKEMEIEQGNKTTPFPIEAAEMAFLRGKADEGYRQLERARDAEWISRSGERFLFVEVYFPELKREAKFQQFQRDIEQRLAALRQRVRAEGL
jgi:TolB-like protein/Tfp pilus assembly protein PilF